jgi:hypothetical protein
MDIGYAQSIQSLPTAVLDVPRRRRGSAFTEGFSLHAGVHLHANDREGLERLCSYGARGPLSLDRLWQLEDGRVCYRMKRPLPDGRCELLLAPTELLRRLAALVPPPRRHLVRFHGVYLPNGTVHVLGGGDFPLTNHLVYDTAADSWSSGSPIPIGILDPATVTDGKLIYLVGAPPDFPRGPAHTQIYDAATNSWREGPRLPPWPRFPDWNVDNTSGTIANDVFYVMGGAIAGGTVWFNYSIPVSKLSAFSR